MLRLGTGSSGFREHSREALPHDDGMARFAHIVVHDYPQPRSGLPVAFLVASSVRILSCRVLPREIESQQIACCYIPRATDQGQLVEAKLR